MHGLHRGTSPWGWSVFIPMIARGVFGSRFFLRSGPESPSRSCICPCWVEYISAVLIIHARENVVIADFDREIGSRVGKLIFGERRDQLSLDPCLSRQEFCNLND